MSNLDKTILIIEDEKPLLLAISRKLESYGFDSVTARSVEQALGYLHDLPQIDAIWLDHYLLGKLDGLDFLQHVKQSEWKDIPVFVVTNTGGEDKRSAYLQFGAKEYYINTDFRLDALINHSRTEILK